MFENNQTIIVTILITFKASRYIIGCYIIGQKHCRICDIFVKWEEVWYLCCVDIS
jgi:hypothetical protein